MAGQSLPRAGHVSQLRQNWTVYEDEALATRIQHEEINHHYQGNKSRNQQIRADLPQAKEIQSHEIEEAQEKIQHYRRQLQAQSEADSKLALELALAHKSGFLQTDDEYTRKRDELFARNIQDLENRYRSRQSAGSSSMPYNDTEYTLKVAKPAIVTDEPLYANNVEEQLMSEICEARPATSHRPLSRVSGEIQGASSRFPGASHFNNMGASVASSHNSLGAPAASSHSIFGATSAFSYNSLDAPSGASFERLGAPADSFYTTDAPPTSSYNSMDATAVSYNNSMNGPAVSPIDILAASTASYNLSENPGYKSMVGSASTSYSMGGAAAASFSSSGTTTSYNMGAPGLPGASSYNMGSHKNHNKVLNTSPGVPSSSLAGAPGGQKRNIEDLNTSSDYVTSSRTSERSDSSLTSYSELGACGGGAYSLETPMPDDVLGIRSALSPDEIEAAEAAERLLEQERKDAELALRLQEELQITEGDHNDDRKLALEAQDREFARVLQAKEKAKAKRAKEKARQRKLERQRQEAERLETLESTEAVPSLPLDGRLSRGDNDGRITRTEGAQSRQSNRDSQISPRINPSSPEGRNSRLSPRSPELNPPARKPYVHTEAIDSHMNDTYCKTQITPTQSISSENSEPQYANLDERGQPLKTEPILHLPSSKSCDKISPRQSAMNEDMPIPPYMPMQSSASRKSEDMERKIKKKKEKEGCKQQ